MHCETGPDKCYRCREEVEFYRPKSALQHCPCRYCKANGATMGPNGPQMPQDASKEHSAPTQLEAKFRRGPEFKGANDDVEVPF